MIKRISHRTFASIGVHLRLTLVVLLFVLPVSAQTANFEWRYYGGDEGDSRYSPLAQINTSNVQSLKRAWTYHTGELDLGLATASFQASFSCTPLVIDGVIYLSTSSSRVIALNAETGRELWKFDPQENKSKREFNSHRGVAYWEDKKNIRAPHLVRHGGWRLIELNADTGKPVSQFGVDGVVDLVEELEAKGLHNPGTQNLTPITFQGRNSGKQFVVVASGGGGFLRSLSRELSDAVVAYALP